MVNREAIPALEGQQVSARMHIPAEPAEHSRPSMSTDRITAAALQIVDTEGSQALTMRRLGASPRPESDDAVPLRPSPRSARTLDGDPLPARHLGRSAAGLAHLPAIAHNLLRAAGSLASLAHGKARSAALRLDLIDVAARTARPRAHHVASIRRLTTARRRRYQFIQPSIPWQSRRSPRGRG
jgi:hypothetical protein